MLVDKTRVANMALGNIGEPAIQSLQQPGRPAAACNQRYDEARVETLAGAPWGFAKRFRVGVPVVVDPFPGWTYVFAYPQDALTVFYIDHPAGTDAPEFIVHDRQDGTPGKLISTNEAAPTFIYTVDKEDLATWDWLAIISLSWLLTSKVAMPITKNPKIEANAFQRHQQYQAHAQATSRTESPDRTDHERFAAYQEARF